MQSKQGEMANQLHTIQSRQQQMDTKQDLMDHRLQQLLQDSAARTEASPDIGRDRRRLKERLKRAARNTPSSTKRTSWLEAIFGICPGDQRMGTEGSRCLPAMATNPHQKAITRSTCAIRIPKQSRESTAPWAPASAASPLQTAACR